jgi:glycosyltransferase involved in cell wall biosynthesis
MENGVKFYTFAELVNGAIRIPPDLIHIWTPREKMREFYREICRQFAAKIPYIIHREDNELVILADHMRISSDEIDEVCHGLRTLEVPSHLTHPVYGRQMLESASGVTALIESLTVDLPAGLPNKVFAPGFESIFSIPILNAGRMVRDRLGISSKTSLVTYTGNVHESNVVEVRSLYLAIALANRMGTPVKLLRTGLDFVQLDSHGQEELRKHEINFGFVPRGDLPLLVHAADLLIQPGADDNWNAQRFPSKLPDFLVSGRPVMLPKTNLGTILQHGLNAIVLPKANAQAITAGLLEWLPRADYLQKIGAGGRAFAVKYLKWSKAVDSIDELYRRILERPLSVKKADNEIN